MVFGYKMRLRRGTSATETAVALALLVTIISAGAWMLSEETQGIFAQVAQLPGGDAPARSRATVAKAPKATAPVEPKAESLANIGQHWHHWLVIGLLTAGAAAQVWLVVRLWKRNSKPREEDTDFPQEEAELANLHPSLVDKRQDLLLQMFHLQQRGQLLSVRVKDVMSRSLLTCTPETPKDEVLEAMKQRGIRHMLVCQGEMQLVGVVSVRDVAQRDGKTAQQLMSQNVVTLASDTELIPAVTTLMNRRVSALPIVENNKLVGILTTSDLMLLLQCMFLMEQRTASETGESVRQTKSLRGKEPSPRDTASLMDGLVPGALAAALAARS
jgi:CBS domain-containing protein